jgi:hypothetical protein
VALFAFAAAGAVTIVAVALIVLALVSYLLSIILALRKVTAGLAGVLASLREMVNKSAPVNGVVETINEHLDAGVDLLEGLLVKKAGVADAVGLVEGLYPGSGAAGFRRSPASRTTAPAIIGDVYPRGTLSLERLTREATIAAESTVPPAPDVAEAGGDAAAKPDPSPPAPPPPSAVVGTVAPIQYGPSPQDTISWGRAPSEPEPAAPEPPTDASEQTPAPPDAAEPKPAPPDAPKIISWKRS